MDAIPIGVLFVITVVFVVVAIEVGYRVGRTSHRSSSEPAQQATARPEESWQTCDPAEQSVLSALT